eukprot:4103769-Prymnesium_polylepis.1
MRSHGTGGRTGLKQISTHHVEMDLSTHMWSLRWKLSVSTFLFGTVRSCKPSHMLTLHRECICELIAVLHTQVLISSSLEGHIDNLRWMPSGSNLIGCCFNRPTNCEDVFGLCPQAHWPQLCVILLLWVVEVVRRHASNVRFAQPRVCILWVKIMWSCMWYSSPCDFPAVTLGSPLAGAVPQTPGPEHRRRAGSEA